MDVCVLLFTLQVAKTKEVLSTLEAQKKAKLLAARNAALAGEDAATMLKAFKKGAHAPEDDAAGASEGGASATKGGNKFKSAVGKVGLASGFVKELQVDSALTNASSADSSVGGVLRPSDPGGDTI